jgi:hypothetical protein
MGLGNLFGFHRNSVLSGFTVCTTEGVHKWMSHKWLRNKKDENGKDTDVVFRRLISMRISLDKSSSEVK